MKKLALSTFCIVSVLCLSGCTSSVNHFKFWEWFGLVLTIAIFIGGIFVYKIGEDNLETLIKILGWFMAVASCTIWLLIYGIFLGVWWFIIVAIIAIILFAVLTFVFEG